MLGEAISNYNASAFALGKIGQIGFINNMLVLGTVEQFDYGNFQCVLVERPLNETEAYQVVTAMHRALSLG